MKLRNVIFAAGAAALLACNSSERVNSNSDNGGGTAGDRAFTGARPGANTGSGLTGARSQDNADRDVQARDQELGGPQGRRAKGTPRAHAVDAGVDAGTDSAADAGIK